MKFRASRLSAGIFTLTTILSVMPSARAVEVVVKNDSLVDGGSASIQAGFVANESAAAWLTAPCSGNIVAIQVFWASLSGGTGLSVEDSISIYPGGTFPNPSGTPVVLEAPVMNDGVMNEFRFLDENNTVPINIPVTQGQVFVVSFKFFNSPSQSNGPSVVTDVGSGCQNGKNGIFAIPPGAWFNSCFFGVSGDFVIRAVIDGPACGGACCLSTGTCTAVAQASACQSLGGTFQGIGTVCTPNPCPQPSGACCRANGTCDANVLQSNCQGAGNIFHLGATCGEVTCPQPTGRCCRISGTACEVLTQAQCQSINGIFAGFGTNCSGSPCSGACCNPTTSLCSVQSLSACTSFNAHFQGFGTTCNGSVCPTGACCMPNGSCSVLTAFNCNAAGGNFNPGETCVQAECPQPMGACCLNTGGCVDSEEAPCVLFGHSWAGAGTLCPEDCQECAGADGDINSDTIVNGNDVGAFTSAVLGSPTPDEVCHGDFSGANGLDTGDVPGLVAALLAAP